MHYWIATQEHRRSNFITIRMNEAITDMLHKTGPTDNKTVNSLLSLVEMYFCLQFRALHTDLLKFWMPDGMD